MENLKEQGFTSLEEEYHNIMSLNCSITNLSRSTLEKDKQSLEEQLKNLEEKQRRFSRLNEKLEFMISELHKQNIVHRDLKCNNIMIDKNNNIKLIDFGLSKIVSPEEEQSSQTNPYTENIDKLNGIIKCFNRELGYLEEEEIGFIQ